ncbi:helix-turn-helix transcriptional regulator [Streptomyces sp. ISL-100]|uniref:helix-turn-helix domain-containing protein n=1 Tax=Streptomyces sp. ISL-100 TaxID=2819173 RepID=UPI001BE8B497|nr:helix-turn-helix transcriptional regulator [Streptomyces sp. ISL-100]MBT2400389.1 helix-turn-helix transcriptional regulator [Streptomyces sp. ISL-100]
MIARGSGSGAAGGGLEQRSPRARRERGRGPDDDRPAIWVGYGKLLKLFRDKAGLSQEALAEAVGYSYEQTASIEQGRRPAKARFTERAEEVLGAGGVLAALQEEVDLARLPRFFRNYAVLEAEALSFFWYGGYVVPGLLQTEGYARALLGAHFPPVSDELLEGRLSARMDRQRLLDRQEPPVVATFLIEEVVLHRPVGGAVVMKRQFQQLLERGGERNIQIQIVPTALGAHPGLNGSMVLLETAERKQVAYVESQDIGMVVSEPDKVSDLWLRYGMLRSQALNIGESARLIERVMGEL